MNGKKLLNLGTGLVIAISAQAQAQVFQETFDAQSSDTSKVAWYEFINSEEGDTREVSNGALNFHNDAAKTDDNSHWMRAVKFRKLPLQEGKSYRLNFNLKGSNTYLNADNAETKTKISVGLAQGGENADIFLKDAKGNDFRYEISFLNPNEYENYTRMFYFANEEMLKQAFAEAHPDAAPLADTFFATLNIMNPGDFTIDDVKLVESSIEGIQFGGMAIRVDFGYNTNIAKLAAASKTGVVILANDCVKVKIGGNEVAPESVELRQDGHLYIFINPEMWLDASATVEVDFTNPADSGIEYEGTLAPEGAVMNFVAEAGKYNNSLEEVYSFAYEPAKVVSSTPANGSFAHETTINEFTFNYDKKIYSVKVDDNEAPTAVLRQGDYEEPLKLKEGTDELTNTLTFIRTSDRALGKGDLTISVSVAVTEKLVPNEPQSMTIELGKVQLSRTEYNLVADTKTQLEGEGGIPAGWTLLLNDAEWAGGSQSRGFMYTESNVQSAFYLRNWEGPVVAKSPVVSLPDGDVELRVFTAGWGATGTVKMTLKNAAGEAVLEKEISVKTQLNKDRKGVFQVDPIRIKAVAGDYTMEFDNPSAELLVAGFESYTYTETAGDKVESEMLIEQDFVACGGNMPADGSGWLVYENDKALTPGTGRSGTSGILNLGTGGMPAAFFARECGGNNASNAPMRITYGEMEGGPQLVLPAGSYELSYKSATWNDAGGNANGTSKTWMQLVDAETQEVFLSQEHVNSTAANYLNGVNNNANVEADKIKVGFSIPAGQTFILKAWGTVNTVIGDIKLEKLGLKAAKYAKALEDAVKVGKEELANSEDPKNDGTTKTNLQNLVTKYSGDNDLHTDADVDAAIAEIENTAKALKTRRQTIINYDGYKEKIANFIETIPERFNGMDCVESLKATYPKYKDVAAQSLEDAELISATETLSKSYELSNHMTTEGVSTLTEQLVELSKQLIELDPSMDGGSLVLAAGTVCNDDQTIAHQLQMLITKAIYEKCAKEENPFHKNETLVDPETLEETVIDEDTPFNASWYVQNHNIYCVSAGHEKTNISNYPGWNLSEGENVNLRPNYGWGGWTGTETHLINKNMFIGIGYEGNAGVNVFTNVENLPVGIYDITIQTMDRSGVDKDPENEGSYIVVDPSKQEGFIYYQQGDADPVAQPFDVSNIGQYYNFTDDVIENVTLTGDLTAAAKIGAYIHANNSFAAINSVTLTLKAKAPGFDYAKAAEEYGKLVTATPEVQAPEGNPVKVEFFGADGIKTNNPQGLTIKVETWANGYMKVSKLNIK